jgi:two-component system, cell cycle sensor histidine kinase and response regulator CckA
LTGVPTTSDPTIPQRQGPAPVGGTSGLRILLVEDTPEDACLLQALLEHGKPGAFQIEAADSLDAALARLSAGPVDAVILDLCLPDSSGIATLERLQAHAPSLPILVLTALQDESLADEAIRRGAQDYLIKGKLDGALVVRAVRYGIERKRAENALRRSEERFELMARATNDAVWDWNLTTNQVWWNVGVRSFLGYPPDHVGIDVDWWRSHIHAEDRERIAAGMRAVIEGGGRFWLDEYRYRCADGTYACVFDRGYVQRDEAGRPVRMIGAMMDITDRKRAEEALRETNETLRTLIQASPLGIAVTDAEEKLRIWNPAAERLFGWKAHEVLGRLLPPLTAAAAPGGFPGLLGRALGGESITGTEFPCVRRDGAAMDVSVSMAPLRDARGGICGAMAVAADVSERRVAEVHRLQLEEQLRQSQKMEAVGRLAGGIAHDFNNLLTAVSGYAELLQARFGPDDPNRTYVDEILRSSGRAASLTRQLLAFSRRQVLQPRILDLNAVIRGIDGLLRRLIGEHIELSTSLAGPLGTVKADQGQIEQVIMNLAVNARDAMTPRGGRLTIETREVEVGPDYAARHGRARSGPHIMLSVSDTGCGMDAATQSHLFEPFFTTKEQGKGTGLGLATVYGIVKQSGGDIWAYSEPGIGSTFKIYLPRMEDAPQARPPEPPPRIHPQRGHETILLVEDSEIIRRLLKEILSQRGYRLLVASDGEEALRVDAEHLEPIHLLLTDVVMPRMNGRELAQKLVPRRPGIKVLFMSGYTEEAIAKHGILDPGTSFLEKPFSPDVLARKIRDLLEPGGKIQ